MICNYIDILLIIAINLLESMFLTGTCAGVAGGRRLDGAVEGALAGQA